MKLIGIGIFIGLMDEINVLDVLKERVAGVPLWMLVQPMVVDALEQDKNILHGASTSLDPAEPIYTTITLSQTATSDKGAYIVNE